MRTPFFFLLALFFAIAASGQEQPTKPVSGQEQTATAWEQVWQQMNSGEDMEEGEWEECYEHLQQLAEQPLDLNTARSEDLEQLPFLSEQQVEDIMAYVEKYGPLRSTNELNMVRSLDDEQRTLLSFFVCVGQPSDKQEPPFPSLATIGKEGQHTLTATARVPFYDRKGDEGGYLGYKYRHTLRYTFSYGDRVKAGLVGAQDAGEPFFSGRNRWGYDAYTYYLQIRRLGILENAVAGKYKVRAGMGLVVNTGFSLGKQFALQSLGRQTTGISAHASRTEANYFQGAAATVRLARPLALTAFVSYRAMDATLNDDGSAATLISSGYHRTQAEMDKKDNTHLTATGLLADLRLGGLRLGANVVYTSLDRSLEPNRQTLYRQHDAHGRHFFNGSVNYAYTHHRFSLSGETAVNGDGALATVNRLSLQPASSWALVVMQRFYSYRYTGLYSHAFSNGGRTQNESGVYLGGRWQPLRSLALQAYVDYAYSPWARYQVSQSSHAWDFLAQADWQRQRWNIQTRYRLRLRQKDNATKTALADDREQRLRLAATYSTETGWSSKTQGDMAFSDYKAVSRGWMVSEHIAYRQRLWQATLSAGYFHTDDYESRVYVYERQMEHEFSFPMYYGRGLRLALFASADVLKNLRLTARLGFTAYHDRNTIGSGLQQIDGARQTDLDMQLKWRF